MIFFRFAFHVEMLAIINSVMVNRYKSKEGFKKRHYDGNENKNELTGSAKLFEYRKNSEGQTKKIIEQVMHLSMQSIIPYLKKKDKEWLQVK